MTVTAVAVLFETLLKFASPANEYVTGKVTFVVGRFEISRNAWNWPPCGLITTFCVTPLKVTATVSDDGGIALPAESTPETNGLIVNRAPGVTPKEGVRFAKVGVALPMVNSPLIGVAEKFGLLRLAMISYVPALVGLATGVPFWL